MWHLGHDNLEGMSLLRRAIPAKVRKIAEQLTGERVLAASRVVPLSDVHQVAEGLLDPMAGEAKDWALATMDYVVILRDDIATGRQWCDVDRAALDPLTANLNITWADASPAAELRLANTKDPKFAAMLHDRVQASVILAETVRLPGQQIVRVAVRRDAAGELFSQVIGPGTIRLDDPQTAALIDTAESRIRDACGLPR